MTEWTDIATLVDEAEQDPVKREWLRQARRELAPICYPEGGPNYERMMRGERPKPDNS